MQIRFVASQSVAIAVPEEPVPIRHYLRQPQRLVYALFDPSRIEQLNHECFRLRMRPLTFIMLNIQPIVDLSVKTASDGTVNVQSTGYEIGGIEYFNQHFTLNLVGKLYPYSKHGQTHLQGKADLQVQVELPPLLRFTPKQLIETTGNGLLKSILLTIKQRLMHQLLNDYRNWTRTGSAIQTTSLPPGLPANPPTV